MKKIIVIIITLILSFILGWNLHRPNNIIDSEIIYRDSLIRDTIYKQNDSINKELDKIDTIFIKEKDSILSNSDSANFKFFSKYIENFNNK